MEGFKLWNNKPLVLNKQHSVVYHLVSEFQLMLLLLTTVRIVNRASTALGCRIRGRHRSEEGLAGFGVLFFVSSFKQKFI